MLARRPLTDALYEKHEFDRHWKLWLVITVIVFLANNYWLYAVLAAYVLLIAGLRDDEPLALYFIVLFAAPHFTLQLVGFGPIQNLFAINHIRLLNLAILLPLAISLRKANKDKDSSGFMAPDLAVLGYISVILLTELFNGSFTAFIRTSFYQFIGIGLPYYVASRAVFNIKSFRTIAAAILLATTILGLIAIFETLKGWLLYEELRSPLGAPLPHAAYNLRSTGGPLRAIASTTYPIILGYVLMIGVGMYVFLAKTMNPVNRRYMAAAALAGGMIATFSRGPWVGTAAMLLLLAVLGPGKGKRLSMTLGIGGLSVLVLLTSPYGQTVLEFLPFIGNVQSENIEYRERLFDVSMAVFWQNPIFGDVNFIRNPMLEQMRQGQGIIDMVNTYLLVALPHGFVGLFFFVATLLLPAKAAWKARKSIVNDNPEAELLGRVLIAIMLGIGITIATASPIGAIGTLHWLMAGLCMSYARMLNTGNPVKVPNDHLAVPGR